MTDLLNKNPEEMNKTEASFYQSMQYALSKATEEDVAKAKAIATEVNPTVETITPTVASILVRDHNNRNRDLSIAKVNGYRDAMLRGEWKLNHQGIAFYPDGNIADGQHRLYAMALVKEKQHNFSTQVLVVPGFDKDAINTIDVSKARNVGDALKLIGIENYKIKGALAKSILVVVHEIEEGAKMKAPTVKQAEDFVQEHNDKLDFAVNESTRISKETAEPVLSIRDGAEVIFLLTYGGYTREYAVTYVEQLQKGEAPYSGAPHGYLTKVLTKAKYADRNKDKLTHKEKLALLLRGAYKAAQGANVTKVAWNAKKESFPTNHPPEGTQADANVGMEEAAA